MKNITLTIFSVFSLCLVPELFSGNKQWFLALYCRDMQICFIVSFTIMSLPKHHTGTLTACMVFLVYTLAESHLYFLDAVFGYSIYCSSWYIVTVIMAAIYIFNMFKQFEYKSDKINEDMNVYLCFWKPKTGITLAASLVGLPFGGLSVYCKGNLYGYRWGYPAYMKQKIDRQVIQKCFVVVDTELPCGKMINVLDNIVGYPAGIPRVRCIYVIKEFLNQLGGKYRVRTWLDLIPTFYSFGKLGNERHSHS